MRVVVLDFETMWDSKGYTLSKMTNESYVRDPRFHAHGVGLVWLDGEREWISHDQIPAKFAQIDWTDTAAIAHHCLPAGVEVLTQGGKWVDIKEVSTNDVVMQWDSATGGLAYAPVLDKIVGHSDTLYAWDSGFHKCSYTSKHRMYYTTPELRQNKGWKSAEVEDVIKLGANNVYIPLSGEYAPENSLDLSASHCRLMEAIRADGSLQVRDGRCVGVGFHLSKPRKISRLRLLCTAVGVELKEHDTKDEAYSFRIGLCGYLERIYPLLTADKCYGEWVLALNLACKRAILDEAKYWDGSVAPNSTYGAYNFSTTCPRTAQAFELMAHTSGWSMAGDWKPNDRGFGSGSNKSLYVARIRPRSEAKLQYKPKEIEHHAPVYCITVPSGAFMIRSNGRVLITGNSHFDGSILGWIYGIRPAFWLCTLSMGRALFPGSSVSLANLTKKLGITIGGSGKGEMKTDGVVRLTPEQDQQLGIYCLQDCDLTMELWKRMKDYVPMSELKVIDMHIRMFTEPILQLNVPMLEDALAEELARKQHLTDTVESYRAEIGSDATFAALLEGAGVEPPMKLSPAALKKGEEKWVYAFAKSDEEFLQLKEHPDEYVQALVAARLGVKSSITETRTERFLGIASRGPWPIYYNYYGGHTGRASGGDKVNPQNLTRGSKLRESVEAPEGHVLVVRDLSQIEARVLACLAGQWNIVEAFAQSRDVYSEMASVIFGRHVDRKNNPDDFIPGFIGKAVVLGCGYGLGWKKFQGMIRVGMLGMKGITFGKEMMDQLNPDWQTMHNRYSKAVEETKPLSMTYEQHLIHCACAKHIIDTFRNNNPAIVKLWKEAGDALPYMVEGCLPEDPMYIGVEPHLHIGPECIWLPNGMRLAYPHLRKEGRDGYTKMVKKGNKVEVTKIYSGSLVENCVQALARIVVTDAMLEMKRIGLRIVLMTHDEVVVCCKEEHGQFVYDKMGEVMSIRPEWSPSLPLDSEGGFARNYSK